MLSGRYPSDEFAELRPRITWDRDRRARCARARARRRLAIVNARHDPRSRPLRRLPRGRTATTRAAAGASASSTRRWSSSRAPARCSSSARRRGASRRSRTTACSSRPRPGSPARCRSGTATARAGRSSSARAIGELARTLAAARPAEAARAAPRATTASTRAPPRTSSRTCASRREATGEVPSDRTIVVERFRDEIGDWRVCVLSPFGARVHAPWATAVAARGCAGVGDRRRRGDLVRRRHRVPPPRVRRAARDVALPARRRTRSRTASCASLGESSLFAARFRENAARALLLPRRHPGRRSAALGAAQARRPICSPSRRATARSRSCSRRTASACATSSTCPALVELLRGDRVAADPRGHRRRAHAVAVRGLAALLLRRQLHLRRRRAARRAPRAGALGRPRAAARAARRGGAARAARSGRDRDARALAPAPRGPPRPHARRAPRPAPRARRSDGGGDPRALGEPRRGRRRGSAALVGRAARRAGRDRRRAPLRSPRRTRAATATRSASCRRRACRPRSSRRSPIPLGDLLSRYARTHGPFRLDDAAARFGIAAGDGAARARAPRGRAAASSRATSCRGGRAREWCDAEVLRVAQAPLAREAAPRGRAGRARRARPLPRSSGRASRGRAPGLDALLVGRRAAPGRADPGLGPRDARSCRRALERYRPARPRHALRRGRGRWRGHRAARAVRRAHRALPDGPGSRSSRRRRARRRGRARGEDPRALLAERGALFFADLAAETGAFAGDLLAALWDLVWAGEVTNDTLAPLRSLLRGAGSARRGAPRRGPRQFVSRRRGPAGQRGPLVAARLAGARRASDGDRAPRRARARRCSSATAC